MSTEVRTYIRSLKRWSEPVMISKGKSSEPVPNFKDDGTRENYIFSCSKDDSQTEIKRAENVGVAGKEDPPYKVFKVLKDGENTELTLKSLSYQGARLFQITHVKGK